MAATASDHFVCNACGYATSKWIGFCPQCRGGEVVQAPRGMHRMVPVRMSEIATGAELRQPTGVSEFDRVLGGGLVSGASVLVGGEPGVGKSTLLMQIAAAVASRSGSVLFASAEESETQVAMRSARIVPGADDVFVLGVQSTDGIIDAARALAPALLVVDSIQTISTSGVDGVAGGVTQVRESAARLVHFAKETGIPTVLVGHVTKDGGLAGPKILEHVVDVVLTLEGDLQRGLRFLRCLKNRFGAVHDVGLFEMSDAGMLEVDDSNRVLVDGRTRDVPGSVLFATVEGKRPMLVEIQALVSRSSTPQPRRSVRGLEMNRVHQVLAVLERHCGIRLADSDVFVSVIGGIKVRDPGADLPVALAIASSVAAIPVSDVVAWGEVGLTGEVRPVSHAPRRCAEAARLGMGRVVEPESGRTLVEMLAHAGVIELAPLPPTGPHALN